MERKNENMKSFTEYAIRDGALIERKIKEKTVHATCAGNAIQVGASYINLLESTTFTSKTHRHRVTASVLIANNFRPLTEKIDKGGQALEVYCIYRSDTLPINSNYIPSDRTLETAIPIFYRGFAESTRSYKELMESGLVREACVQYKIPGVYWYWVMAFPVSSLVSSSGTTKLLSRPLLIMSMERPGDPIELYVPPISNVSGGASYCLSTEAGMHDFPFPGVKETYDHFASVVSANRHNSDWHENVNTVATDVLFKVDSCNFKPVIKSAEQIPSKAAIDSTGMLARYGAPKGRRVIEAAGLIDLAATPEPSLTPGDDI